MQANPRHDTARSPTRQPGCGLLATFLVVLLTVILAAGTGVAWIWFRTGTLPETSQALTIGAVTLALALLTGGVTAVCCVVRFVVGIARGISKRLTTPEPTGAVPVGRQPGWRTDGQQQAGSLSAVVLLLELAITIMSLVPVFAATLDQVGRWLSRRAPLLPSRRGGRRLGRPPEYDFADEDYRSPPVIRA